MGGIGLARHKGLAADEPGERRYCDSLTERVLAAVFEVSNTLGAGFLKKVYERALLTELGLRGIRAYRPSFIFSG